MSTSLLHIIFSAAWILGNWYLWKRYSDKLYFCFVWVGFASLATSLWAYISQNVLEFSGKLAITNSKVIMLADIIIIAGILVIFLISRGRNKV